MTNVMDVIARGPTGATEWIGECREGRVAAPGAFNWWLGLLFVLTQEARTEAETLGTTAWANAALCAYQLVAERASEQDRFNVEEREAHLRCGLIAALGERGGDPIRDPSLVLRWITNGLPELTETITRQLGRLDLPASDLLRLRRIKHRLAVADDLSEAAVTAGGSLLATWLSLKNELP